MMCKIPLLIRELLMRKGYLVLIFLLLNHFSFGQELLWANKVLEKSSENIEENSPKNKAIQILGKPSVIPQAVTSACSWHPMGSNYGEDYIKVGFEKAIKVKQIVIGETVNAGGVARIMGYTPINEEILLWENNGSAGKSPGRLWNIFVPETVPINAIKLLIVHSLAKGKKEYDCIGISNSDEPIIGRINLAENIPDDLQSENLGSGINSRFGEVAPIVSPDGKNLFFTRLNHPGNVVSKQNKNDKNTEIAQDVWVSKIRKDGTWETASNLGEPINNLLNNAAVGITSDGKSLFLLNVYLPNGDFVAGLSKSSKKGNKWEMPKQINIDDFQALEVYDDRLKFKKNTEYAISSNEKYIVMALKRNETFGDNDLYVSLKKSNGNYSKPINLGSMLNSAGNEGSPFLASDNKTLYFNSNGHPGYGDADIFVTTRLDDSWTKWSEPFNLGPSVNSSDWDGYISIPASGEYAYFVSLKKSNGAEDIFKIKLFPSIKPQILALYDFQFKDNITGANLKPKLEFLKMSLKSDSTEVVEYSIDDESNEYKSIVPIGFQYKIKATLTNYADFNITLDLSKDKKYREIKVIYDMMPLANGQRMILNNLFFDQGKAIIKEESFPALNNIKRVMVEKPTMEILLEGHTDNQGDMMLNIKLAEDRVKAVKDYLTKDGTISTNRISFKSWGPYRPVGSNSTEEERKKNRRVEFTIQKM